MTAAGPAVAARRTAGTAEMIGPMIGTSSRTPGDDRQQERVATEDRVDQLAQDDQPDEREDPDRRSRG